MDSSAGGHGSGPEGAFKPAAILALVPLLVNDVLPAIDPRDFQLIMVMIGGNLAEVVHAMP